MHIKNKRGQSTVEYVLLVTAVVAVMIVFASSNNGGFQKQLNASLNTASSDMNTMADKLTGSHVSRLGGTGTPDYKVGVDPGSSDGTN